MYSGLLESFEGSGLGGSQARLSISLGKGPAASAGLHQEKLDDAGSNPEADGGYFFAFPERAQVRQAQKSRRSIVRASTHRSPKRGFSGIHGNRLLNISHVG
jgi:hypothetical protein